MLKEEECSKELNLSDSDRFEIAEMILPQKAYETAYSKIKTLDTKNTFNHFNIKEDSCSSTGLIVVLAKKFKKFIKTN